MVDPVQVILLVVIVVLAILLVVLGVQIFFILKEVRTSLKKANKILDRADSITENIEEPLSAISSLILGIKSGSFITIAKFVKNFISHDKEEKKDKD